VTKLPSTLYANIEKYGVGDEPYSPIII